ncbi:hypothetical protein [Antarctobacter heliothermus]|uniref:DUF3618 domain-containing protein n=1 Tax=Antarctobacter heliothermus TaxID=74033 RepID=A0A239F6Z3_9RHOB|nr:hypothetical protein [Antarctobacter heliothermus]SNS52585.1 hypothetical protein SAMN04488078_101885 [Antarctobacter heliothermus]
MAEIEELEMRAAEDRARLKIALEALGGSTRGSAVTGPLAGVAQHQAGRITRGALGAARRNPGAAALIGIGVALFATGSGRGKDDGQAASSSSGFPVGALALGIGALAAALYPATRRDKPSK